MGYKEDVQRGRELLKRGEQAQWALAELSWQVNKAGVSMSQWARDIGCVHSHVSALISIWNTWRTARGQDRPPFAEAYLIAHEGNGSLEEAQQTKIDRRAQSEIERATPQVRKEVAAELIKDPEIRRHAINELVRSEEAMGEIEDARRTRYSWSPSQPRERDINEFARAVVQRISGLLNGDQLDKEIEELVQFELEPMWSRDLAFHLDKLAIRASERAVKFGGRVVAYREALGS